MESARQIPSPANDSSPTKPWNEPSVLTLVESRRGCRCPRERALISKAILKEVRRHNRIYHARRAEAILAEFKNLSRMNNLHRLPVINERRATTCDPEAFADLLQEVYASDSPLQGSHHDSLKQLPDFTFDELIAAIRALKRGKACDKEGVVAEMVKHAPPCFHRRLLTCFNQMLADGETNAKWKHVFFTMMPKSGDLTQATNWRPIAVLPIFYKVFARMVYHRLKPTLENHQCSDQTGFRTGIRLEEALVIAEMMVSKTAEYNLPLYIASLDLKKAFDRIEHKALIEALEVQGLDDPYIALLLDMYSCQTGSANGSRTFQINRGVCQGDVLSSLLFNAALEIVFQRWKEKLRNHGWHIGSNQENLTNTRYADDVLLYAKSMKELKEMLELLLDELRHVGLEMHESKTKILSSRQIPYDSLTVRDLTIQILPVEGSHKYLGKLLCLDPASRVNLAFDQRLGLAWAKFNSFRRWLVNRHIPIHLRLRFV